MKRYSAEYFGGQTLTHRDDDEDLSIDRRLTAILRLLIALGALVMATVITIPKLYKMLQIKGVLRGAYTTTEYVSQKWDETSPDDRRRHIWWIGYGHKDIHQIGGHRTNVPRRRWEETNIGDQIEVIHIPGDRWTYLKDGDIFVSPGHFAFDIVLLAIELTVAATALVRWHRSRLAARLAG